MHDTHEVTGSNPVSPINVSPAECKTCIPFRVGKCSQKAQPYPVLYRISRSWRLPVPYQNHTPSFTVTITPKAWPSRHHRGDAITTLARTAPKPAGSSTDRLIGEWLARSRVAPAIAAAGLTVSELINAFRHHASNYYRKADGTPTGEPEALPAGTPAPAATFGQPTRQTNLANEAGSRSECDDRRGVGAGRT